jgi:hypothetical protein
MGFGSVDNSERLQKLPFSVRCTLAVQMHLVESALTPQKLEKVSQ